MQLEDAKEDLAKVFFECARYERPSREWIAALDAFTNDVIETCWREAENHDTGSQAAHAIRVRFNAEVSGRAA